MLCRVRPVAGAEEAGGVVTFDPDDDGVLHLSDKGKVTTFDLDKVFWPEATQEEVSSCIHPQGGLSGGALTPAGAVAGVLGGGGAGHVVRGRLPRLHLRLRTDGLGEDLHHGGELLVESPARVPHACTTR